MEKKYMPLLFTCYFCKQVFDFNKQQCAGTLQDDTGRILGHSCIACAIKQWHNLSNEYVDKYGS